MRMMPTWFAGAICGIASELAFGEWSMAVVVMTAPIWVIVFETWENWRNGGGDD